MGEFRKKKCFDFAYSPKIFLAVFCTHLLFGCQFQSYQAKPVDPQKITEAFEQRGITDPKFEAFLISQGYAASDLPLNTWDLKALTLCAHYFHPSLNVARVQWKAAQISEKSAAQKPLPTINSTFARSNQANQDINPFAYQFSIDIPIETQNKRQIQIEGFSHLTEIAKLEIAQTAWQLRQQIALLLNEMRWQASQQFFLEKEISHQEKIVAMLEKRKDFGLASSLDLGQTQWQLQSSQMALHQLLTQKTTLQSELAKALGLPLHVVSKMALNLQTDVNSQAIQNADTQKTALQNRLDIRIALEQYKIAENNLKLEIAKQYPDITISPGLAYEFGDTVWSLGFSGLMNLLQKNKIAIAQAEQLREVEVAKFEALQANVISEVNLANAQLTEAQSMLAQKIRQHALVQQNFDKTKSQFDAGEIDRLALTYAILTLEKSEKEIAQIKNHLEKSKIQIENIAQVPLSQ
jgi:outer membrane protein TolC